MNKTIQNVGGGDKIEAIETLKVSISVDDIQESEVAITDSETDDEVKDMEAKYAGTDSKANDDSIDDMKAEDNEENSVKKR